MSITDELRSWARDNTVPGEILTTLPAQHLVRGTVESLLRIAARIDAEHESEISRAAQLLADAEKDRDFNYANWQDCKQKVLQHNITMDELDAEIERLKDELAHCIELPKDADSEPIHVGDVMTPNGMDTGFKVRQMYFDGEWSLDLEGFGISQTCPDLCCHYQKPTVEGVLQELATKVWNRCRIGMTASESGIHELVSEYAAKLMLKED